jgi:hypothetical protein
VTLLVHHHVQFLFTALRSLFHKKCDRLEARMAIYA